MTTSSFAIAIMAAGKGTRLKSKRPKVLHEIGGRALLLHVIAAAKTVVPADHIYCIIGHESDRVRAAVASTGVQFVLQPEQRGTGHAMQMLKADFELSGAPLSKHLPKHLLVLSGDVPLIRPETIATVRDVHLSEKAAMTILTAEPADPTGYGRVLRLTPEGAEVTAIVEQKSLSPEQLDAPEINSGIYCFETKALFDELDALDTNNAHGEFYLTDIAAMLVAEGKRVVAIKADSVDEVLGANTIAEMMHLDAAMRLATARRLMANGVSILDTAEVADNAVLGPYAHLRPESRIGEGAHVGNFVETKKMTMGKGSKANHLNYLGDTVIGAGVNIGAGAITCNYDGVHKHVTTIGDGAFVGSDSTLVAPITIGAGSYVAAGSSITEDVPDGALALGRSRQVTKPGWVAARKAAAQKKEC